MVGRPVTERKKASDFPQPLLDLFDEYVHGGIGRRTLLARARKFAVGGVTAAALFQMLKPNYAWAVQVPPDDKRIKSEPQSVPSPHGNGDDEKAAALFGKVDRGKMLHDFLAAAYWLKARPDCTGKLGAVGFCFGGGIVNQLAVRMGSDLNAAVPFYGAQPTPADVAKIKAPINAQYGALDTRITGGWQGFDAELTAAHVPHEGHIYAGANHGFHNDTTPRYDAAAAKQAWQRTLDWLDKYLRA